MVCVLRDRARMVPDGTRMLLVGRAPVQYQTGLLLRILDREQVKFRECFCPSCASLPRGNSTVYLLVVRGILIRRAVRLGDRAAYRLAKYRIRVMRQSPHSFGKTHSDVIRDWHIKLYEDVV